MHTSTTTATSRPRNWLRALALHRRETFSWAMYDWANSAFATTIMAAVLPIYYASVAGADLPGNRATVYWGYTTALALFLIAIASPILGAVADYMGAKKRFMALFVALGVVATSMLYFVERGQWLLASLIFIAANIGFSGANIFYDSLLPHIAGDDEIDQLSATGYALGYLGGGILLVVNILWILSPHTFGIPDTTTASRLAMFSVAVWWALFSIPLFRYVAEPPRRISATDVLGANPVVAGFRRLRETFSEIRRYRQVLIFLLAFWLYNDGIGTIIKMATIYGTEVGIGQTALIGALILTQFVGIPFAFAFGGLAKRIGAKSCLYLALAVYTLIAIGGYFLSQAWQFWVLAFAVATVQGGAQALSRSLYGSMVPRAQSSEFFGFMRISDKFAGILGPLLFALVGQWTGSSRLSIVALIVFFIGGMLLLTQVDVEEGRRVARLEDSEFRAVPG